MNKPGVMFYFEMRPCLKRLNYTQKGKLFDAILDYGEHGILPELTGAVGVAWDFLQPKLDRDTQRYDRVVLQKRYAHYCRYHEQTDQPRLGFEEWILSTQSASAGGCVPQDTDVCQTPNYKPQTSNPIPQTPNSKLPGPGEGPAATLPFSPPTREEVVRYCREKGYQLDADSFVDYYCANGWRIGKSPMRDWKAAVRRWNRKERENEPTGKLPAWIAGEEL